jgi:hypothetical protein
MIYQHDKIDDNTMKTMYRLITEPTELLLEYRLIVLDPPNYVVAGDEFICGTGSDEYSLRYCILIVQSDRIFGSESRFLYDVSRDKETAETILKALCDGAVTPLQAKYIIEDIL